MERHILVVFPHPDDEAFGSAGYIAMQTQSGVPVTYVCGTLGEMGRNMGNPFFANRETLPEIRKQELEEACRVMGIQDLRLLGLRDKTLEFEDEEMLADRIEEVIHEVNPSLVVTFYPGYAVHPDHDAMGAAAIKAVERLPKDKQPKIYCKAFSKNCREELGEPDVLIDVSPVQEIKLAAIQAHRSQTEGMVASLKEQVAAGNTEALKWITTEDYWTYKTNK
jgi:N-acetylglucosamine malate deacetylase 2